MSPDFSPRPLPCGSRRRNGFGGNRSTRRRKRRAGFAPVTGAGTAHPCGFATLRPRWPTAGFRLGLPPPARIESGNFSRPGARAFHHRSHRTCRGAGPVDRPSACIRTIAGEPAIALPLTSGRNTGEPAIFPPPASDGSRASPSSLFHRLPAIRPGHAAVSRRHQHHFRTDKTLNFRRFLGLNHSPCEMNAVTIAESCKARKRRFDLLKTWITGKSQAPGAQPGAANSKPEKSKPGTTRQLTSDHPPCGAAACQ